MVALNRPLYKVSFHLGLKPPRPAPLWLCPDHILDIFKGPDPNLPDPVNFVPFGMMRYSPFNINLISITCILFVYLYFCLFLNKA